MSKDLVHVSPRRIALEEQHADERLAVAERLAAEAATADERRAHEIMVQGRVIADALKAAQAPFEESREFGKASVLAAQRLGRLLSALPKSPRKSGRTMIPSERGEVFRDLGISDSVTRRLVRLSAVADPDFQRYIQRKDIIPSVTGALFACTHERSSNSKRATRRNTIGIRKPPNPSLDEGYSLIVRAIGHLSPGACGDARSTKISAIRAAVDHLYAAEDLLKPYRAGY